MIYVYLLMSVSCLLMSGMWLGSIFTDHNMGLKISILQYTMTIFMFVVGFLQLHMAYRTFVLE